MTIEHDGWTAGLAQIKLSQQLSQERHLTTAFLDQHADSSSQLHMDVTCHGSRDMLIMHGRALAAYDANVEMLLTSMMQAVCPPR